MMAERTNGKLVILENDANAAAYGEYQAGALAGAGDIIGLIVAVLLLAALIYLLVRPYKESKKLGVKVKVTK